MNALVSSAGMSLSAWECPCQKKPVVIRTKDDATFITLEIVEDIVRPLFMVVVDMSDEAKPPLRN